MTELNIKLVAITSHVHIIGSNTSRLLGFLRIAQAPEASIQQVEISYHELQTILSRTQAIHHSLEDQVSIEICEELFAGLRLVAKKLYKMANLMLQEEPWNQDRDVEESARSLKDVLEKSMLLDQPYGRNLP